MSPSSVPEPHLPGDFMVSGEPTLGELAADYFDIHLDHAPKEGAELVLDPIVLIARSISGGWVSVVGLRLHAANHTVGLRPGDCAGMLPI
jgi:cell volume regulation protein A